VRVLKTNCTLMGQTLFDLLNGRNLKLYPSAELRQQALSTVAIENPRGWRIAKEKASKKIDAIVAVAMASVGAVQRGRVGANNRASGRRREEPKVEADFDPRNLRFDD
jgi:hypothetical protein